MVARIFRRLTAEERAIIAWIERDKGRALTPKPNLCWPERGRSANLANANRTPVRDRHAPDVADDAAL